MDLLHAFLNIRKKIPNLRLVFVGSGPLKSELKGYKNVSVKTVPYSQIQQEYLKSDIFCLPSRATETWEEQYGMCLVEAMACGIPVISTKTGAIPEVCGDSALLFDSGNVAELEKLLTKLIYNKELRLSLGKRGSEIAKDKYDSKKIAAQISDLYKKICR